MGLNLLRIFDTTISTGNLRPRLRKDFINSGRLTCKILNLGMVLNPHLFLQSFVLSFGLTVHSSFFSGIVVVPGAITFVAQPSCESYFISMRARRRFLLSSILTVAVFAHSLGIMLRINVRTVFDREPRSTFIRFFLFD